MRAERVAKAALRGQLPAQLLSTSALAWNEMYIRMFKLTIYIFFQAVAHPQSDSCPAALRRVSTAEGLLRAAPRRQNVPHIGGFKRMMDHVPATAYLCARTFCSAMTSESPTSCCRSARGRTAVLFMYCIPKRQTARLCKFESLAHSLGIPFFPVALRLLSTAKRDANPLGNNFRAQLYARNVVQRLSH